MRHLFRVLAVVSNVFITRTLPDETLAPLVAKCDVDIWEGEDPIPREVLRSRVGEADGLLCMLTDVIDQKLLEAAPRLRVVSQMAVGIDNIDVNECARRGVIVGHTPGVLTETVADTAFALLGAIVRRLPEGEKVVRRGEWGPWSPDFLNGRDLHGTTLGIVGMGRIGHAVARRASGFDMEVVYASPRVANDVEAKRLDLYSLLGRADHVILCVSLNPETHHLIGRPQLEMMGATSYLVNVSRGQIVDTDALVEALGESSIAGAALDVTDPEPLPSDHPLLDLANCLVVPHIGSSSLRTRAEMARMAVDNLLAGLEGRDLPGRYPT